MLSTELAPTGGFLVEAEEETGAGPRIVMLYADHDTQNALTAWARARGFDLEEHAGTGLAFHITLLATRNDVAIPLADHMIEPVTVYPDRLEVLGESTPVLLVSEPDGWLYTMRGFYAETYGAEPTYELKPHVSLSYGWAGEPALDEVEPPDFPLVFDRLVVEAFDESKESNAMGLERKIFGHFAGAADLQGDLTNKEAAQAGVLGVLDHLANAKEAVLEHLEAAKVAMADVPRGIARSRYGAGEMEGVIERLASSTAHGIDGATAKAYEILGSLIVEHSVLEDDMRQAEDEKGLAATIAALERAA